MIVGAEESRAEERRGELLVSVVPGNDIPVSRHHAGTPSSDLNRFELSLQPVVASGGPDTESRG